MQVLIIAAHPDDEVLGVGGTVARHAISGDDVKVIIVAEGATSRHHSSKDDVTDLHQAAKKSAHILGSSEPVFLGLPDNRLDSLDLLEITHAIENQAQNIKPQIVYTHHGGDLNLDHQIVHRAVLTAFRPLPKSFIRKIYGFETLSSTEWGSVSTGKTFSPSRYVDITDTLEDKIKALDCYEKEMRDFPHPRSVKTVRSLASFRGSNIGVTAAEAFEVILDIH